MYPRSEQGAAALPLALLNTKDIAKLCDAAMTAFSQLHDIEMRNRKAAKARLAEELDKLDLFGLTANRADSEAREYRPERGWYE
jgi:hypothetical protein